MAKCLINILHVKNVSWGNIQEDIMTFMMKKIHEDTYIYDDVMIFSNELIPYEDIMKPYITAFRKRHQLISFYKFQSPINQHQQSDRNEMRNFYRPLYKEAVYII